MHDPDLDANFPIETNSPLIRFLQKCIIVCVKVLAVLMTLIIIWGVLDVAVFIYQKLQTPPYFIVTGEDILGGLGGFLAVLIAIELFINIILYLNKKILHLKLVLATALMAIARKVIILDYSHLQPLNLYAISTIVIALGLAYWLTSKKKEASIESPKQ